MSTVIDYSPVLDGVPYDPEPNGGRVTSIALYATAERAGTPVVTAGPAMRISTAHYRFDIADDVPPGRYHLVVSWTRTADADAYTDRTGRLDLPIREDLVVSVEDVIARTGLMNPSPEQREAIADAILDAQADVEAYLGTAITQRVEMVGHLAPYASGWQSPNLDDTATITSATPETDSNGVPTGYFTLTYVTGLDARRDPAMRPIRRYVLAHALNSPEITRMWQASGGRGPITSISAEGQSIAYGAATLGGGGQAGSGVPGALPTLDSLYQWKRITAYQRPTVESFGWWG